MGTKKQVERTGTIEVMAPREFAEACSQIRISLNHLEDKLAKDFPSLNEATASYHARVQEALRGYYGALTDAIGMERIRISEIGAAESSPYARLFPNFIKYLQQFGEAGISYHTDCVQELLRLGVFLKRGNDKHRFLGVLGIRTGLKEREYAGYIPTDIPEKEFFGCAIYHLASPDLGTGNFAFVRLVVEKKSDGTFERVDGFGNRRIEFP